MRTIEFRVWNKVDRHWIDWEDIHDLHIYLNSKHHEVVEFTGLFDKNGKEIYEGDIIEWIQAEGGVLPPEKKAYICQIIWEGTGWSCKHISSQSRFTFSSCHVRVIGTVYDNPELITNSKTL